MACVVDCPTIPEIDCDGLNLYIDSKYKNGKRMNPEYIEKHKIKTLSVLDFIKKYHPGLSGPAISYRLKKGDLDYTRIGNKRFICLTKRTLEYSPNKSKKRNADSNGNTNDEKKT